MGVFKNSSDILVGVGIIGVVLASLGAVGAGLYKTDRGRVFRTKVANRYHQMMGHTAKAGEGTARAGETFEVDVPEGRGGKKRRRRKTRRGKRGGGGSCSGYQP